MARKKLISIDFDGVLHSYASGWQGAGTVSDAPVEGAMDFLRSIVEDGRFDIVISSSRCDREAGREAIRAFLDRHLVEAYGEVVGLTIAACVRVGDGTKPPSYLHIDDRAWTFDGVWPSLDAIDGFKPWNKRDDIVAAAAAAGWKASPAPLHAAVCGIPEAATSDADLAAVYRRLPLDVEAFQFVPDMLVMHLPDWFRESVAESKATFYDRGDKDERKVFDIELEQVDSQYPIEVPANAWVVRGATGSLYVLTDEEFRAGHQPIDGYDEDLAEISRRTIETAPAQTVSDVPVTAMMALHACDCGESYFAPEQRDQCPACAEKAAVETVMPKPRFALGTNAMPGTLELFFLESFDSDDAAKAASVKLLESNYPELELEYREVYPRHFDDIDRLKAGYDVLVEVTPEISGDATAVNSTGVVRVVAVFRSFDAAGKAA
ncbi:MAG: hypothetical protein KAG89_02385 [Fulvimarina manganoxydans]|uniref:HAD domain-containing protein n=1 Tax=Fulvimarina manganoxydans TaxID=937218 RepID=UPI0023520D53|nr:HAD domain-containing protein [Fulvimarina manganoxydans]MCK5930992.1 hypothetical protein [Fulvimarina manganoxydans]